MIVYRKKKKVPEKLPTPRELREEDAAPSMGSIRDPWGDDSVVAGLTPVRLAGLLRNAERGDIREYLTLAMEMEERDLHYASVLATRKRAVEGIDAIVSSASDDDRDKTIAEAVKRDIVDDPEFIDLVSGALDALGKGYSAVEMIWGTGNVFRPVAYKWRDPRWFRFDEDDGRTLRLITQQSPLGEALKPYKWVVHDPRLKMGTPIRGGLARLVAWSFLFKNYAQKDWVSFCETYGLPLRLGKFGKEATEDDKMALLRAVVGIGTDAAAIIPESMQIEFIKAAEGSSSAEVFERLADWLDRQVSKAVLGQTMTADSGSSRSQAEVHDDVRQDIKQADARSLERTINAQVVRPYVDLNFGADVPAPYIRFPAEPDEDVSALVEHVTQLVDRGLPVDAREIYSRIGLSAPGKDAILLHPANKTPAPAPTAETEQAENRRCSDCGGIHHALNRSEAPDTIDTMTAEFLEDWEPISDALVDPILKLAETAADETEFLDGLNKLAAGDTAGLTAALAEALFAARALGDQTDES